MKIRLKIHYTDGATKDVEACFADFVAFERTWQRSVMKMEQEMRLTDLAWLAWHSEKRTKATQKVFDPDWIGMVETLEMNNADESEKVDGPLGEDQPPG
jgi:hypothetical protein